MKYVMSDIHGEYDKFLEMLKKIEFEDADELYILGDMIDRGPKSMELLMDLSTRINVYCLLGNHEYMMMKCLNKLEVEITEESVESQLDAGIMQGYMDWMANGGEKTMEQYKKLSEEEKEGIKDFLSELDLYEMLIVDGKKYFLVHSGIMNFDKSKKMSEYLPEEFLFARPDYSKPYYNKITTVFGHTPTMDITGKPEIYRENTMINIDCGACFEGGRLACLCLETGEEFYV